MKSFGIMSDLGTVPNQAAGGRLRDRRQDCMSVDLSAPFGQTLHALRAATMDAAGFVGGSGEFGVVRPGARADFLLAKDNPLEDVKNASHIVGVMVRGHWLSKAAPPRDLDATQ
jgi:imidazolonepropionase-like amidohydrolase